MKLIRTHKDLDVYKLSFESAMEIFKTTKSFPKEEIYFYPVKYLFYLGIMIKDTIYKYLEYSFFYIYFTGQADQIRRSSRSVSANMAEAFRKRRYPKHFVSKLSDCEAEAARPV